MVTRGSGVLFFDRAARRVLLCRRDNKPSIPFPGWVDILGGYVEEGETPEQTVRREVAEELDDLRSGAPFLLKDARPFSVYRDERGLEHHVFTCEADFEISDLRLNEGQHLLWLAEEQANDARLAFGFERVVREFFVALRDGRV